MEIPGVVGEVSVTIDYTYDPLYRLTTADYDTSEFFHYTYDAVGNRLTQETHEETNTYVYDTANRLVEVDGVTFVWDNNENLIQDDTRIYGYDYANRLTFVLMDGETFNFGYNGLGDRLWQAVNGVPTSYSLDINRGLTQVMADGVNAYLYGVGRIGEEQPDGWKYISSDALGSVRQLAAGDSLITMARAYQPFGGLLSSTGKDSMIFQFTGEQRDRTELIYLRARYYHPGNGTFINVDPRDGQAQELRTLHRLQYALGTQ